ncbi:hypothetical protein B0H13DRAFT_2305624 [Mycena leptocephala]|nr:hypothetical protein B0H13DRAFT_2305624 [Mycena leptocephala]
MCFLVTLPTTIVAGIDYGLVGDVANHVNKDTDGALTISRGRAAGMTLSAAILLWIANVVVFSTRYRVTTHEKNFTAPSDARHRASAREIPLVALYYDEYGELHHSAYAHPDFYDGFDLYDDQPACEAGEIPYYDEPAYSEDAPAGYYEDLPTGYCENAPAASADYDAGFPDGYGCGAVENVDDGCMYEIIYGSDSTGIEGDEIADASDDCDEFARNATAVEDLNRSHELTLESADEVDSATASVALGGGEEHAALAWSEYWEQRPLPGENELAGAELMEGGPLSIEADAPNEVPPAPFEPEPICTPISMYVKEELETASPAPTLEELQTSYDCGEIPQEYREECANILADQWEFELEDQQLLDAGYVWNEEMGEYVQSVETELPDNSIGEYALSVPHLNSILVRDVLQIASIPPRPVFVAPSHRVNNPQRRTARPAFYKAPTRRFSPTPPRLWRRPPAARFAGQSRPFFPRSQPPRHSRVSADRDTKKRNQPPNLPRVTSAPSPSASIRTPANVVATIGPASRATPPAVADNSRCSLDTVPLVAADVHAQKEPVPPDIPASAFPSIAGPPSPAVVCIPRRPKPPNIRNQLAPTRPPNRVGAVVSQLKNSNATAERRRNAQRRLAKKGKGRLSHGDTRFLFLQGEWWSCWT